MEFKTATVNHLPAIVRLLADDEFGSIRESYKHPLPKECVEAKELESPYFVMLLMRLKRWVAR